MYAIRSYYGYPVQQPLFLGIVQGIEHFLAGIDAVKRRHGDVNVAGLDEGGEMAQKERAQQCRNMCTVGVGVGEDTYFAVTQIPSYNFV